jgi:hypothetical protein
MAKIVLSRIAPESKAIKEKQRIQKARKALEKVNAQISAWQNRRRDSKSSHV